MKIVELIITHGIPGVTALVLALAQLLKARAEIQTVQKAEANACSVKAQNERRSEKTSAIRWRRAFWKEVRLQVLIAALDFSMLTVLAFCSTSVTPLLVVESTFLSGQFFFSLWLTFFLGERLSRTWSPN